MPRTRSVDVAGFGQDAAAGVLDHLREDAEPGLHDGDAAGHRLQEELPLLGGLVATEPRARSRVCRKASLPARSGAPWYSSCSARPHDAICLWIPSRYPCAPAPGSRRPANRAGRAARDGSQAPVGLAQDVQSLLGRDACQVADRERLVLEAGPRVAVEVDADRHDVDAAPLDPEILAHPVRAVLAHGHERVDRCRVLANEPQRLDAERLSEAVEEAVFALQRADDRTRSARA